MSRRIPPGIQWHPVPAPSYQPSGRELSGVERAVLGVLLSRWAREEHDAVRIATAALAGEAGFTSRGVRSALRTLEVDGLVKTIASNGGRAKWATYHLTLPGMETRKPVPGKAPANPEARSAFQRLRSRAGDGTRNPEWRSASYRERPGSAPAGERATGTGVEPGFVFRRDDDGVLHVVPQDGAALASAAARRS